jgi:hypothetical protein
VPEIKIAGKLELPLALAADSLAIIARKGRGKTYTGSVVAEELLDAGIPICVLDPQGDWWGLRSSANGKSEGYPVVIMGGEHGDIPLEPTAGKLVADFVLNERVPTILDMSEFSTRADEQRFGVSFLERLFRGKRRDTGVLYLIVDEASTFAPQIVQGEDAKLEGASRNIARRGRTRGLGSMWIDQRAASVNKNVLSQMAGIIVGGITGKHDRKAIAEWVDAKAADDELLKQMLEDLPSLKKGGAYVWVPESDIFERVQIRKRRTFDSSATPEPGQTLAQPRKWSDVDTDALARSMAETVERQKAEDPAELRKQIAELQRELRKAPAQVEAPEPVEVKIEVPVPVALLEPRDVVELKDVLSRIENEVSAFLTRLENLESERADIQAKTVLGAMKQAQRAAPVPVAAPKRVQAQSISSDGSLPNALQKILNSLAWWRSISRFEVERVQVAVIAGYIDSRHFRNLLGSLSTKGLITYPQSGTVALTEEGAQLAVVPEAPMTTEDLHAAVIARLQPAQRKILEPLLEVYPTELDKEKLAELAGYTASRHFDNLLGRLRSLGFIDYPQKGYAQADRRLFV